MPKNERTKNPPLTMDEWRGLPAVLTATEAARAYRVNVRYLIRHHTEFGGVKIGGKYIFSKTRVAQVIGLEA